MTGITAPDRMLTPAQVARILRVHPKTVAKWAVKGRLPHTWTIGGENGRGHRRYREADVRALLAGESR